MQSNFQSKKTYLLLFILFFVKLSYGEFKGESGDFQYIFSGVLKPETYYGKNTSWLNNLNPFDQSFITRYTCDLSLNVAYGFETFGTKVAELFCQCRSKAGAGQSEGIASTTETDIKIIEAVNGIPHKHAFPRQIFWIRELWLQFNIGEALSLPFDNVHTFIVGTFPYQLGRGIALGSAYGIGQDSFGFYADSAIDQYAFGAKFSGELVTRKLSYDLYTAVLQNNSGSLADTAKKVLGQEYGRLETPERGFGKINFLFAGRLNWNVFDNDWLGRMTLEPYALYNSDPEQKIEFRGDATSKLGTVGLAGEFYGPRFEAGFDYAVNLGQQRVKGWDRNVIKQNDRAGDIVIVNDNVNAIYTDAFGKTVTELVPYVKGSKAQNIINTCFRDESQNDQVIGTVDSIGYIVPTSGDVLLKNSIGRFGNPYSNRYKGWMFVADASYATANKSLTFAATFGVTSGDDINYQTTEDHDYNGFIGLQEVYSGKRVRSVFLLGGAGKLKRPLSTPTTVQAPGSEARNISGFTNLVFTGVSLKWNPKDWKKKFELNPNVLALWQEKAIANARTYLGSEVGLFINYNLFKDLKLFWVSSLFFPGSYYKDRQGVAVLNDAELAILDNQDPTGFTQDRIAKLGSNVAYTFNMGLIYSF